MHYVVFAAIKFALQKTVLNLLILISIMLKQADMTAKTGRRRLQGETGSALLASFMLITLITGAGLAAMTTSSVNQNKAKNVVNEKQALYLAEAALNHGKVYLHQTIANWNSYATAQPQTLVPSTSFAGIGSYAVTIKAASGGALFMTATGTAPNNATSSISTLLTLDNGNLLGNAFITGKNLLVSGSPVFSGTSGGIHANGNLTISGDPTIATNAQTTGTYTVTGHPTVAGFAGGGQPQQTINPLNSWQFWGAQDYYFSYEYRYQMNPDGTYYRDADGNYVYAIVGAIYNPNNWVLIADVPVGSSWNCWEFTPPSWWYSTTKGQWIYTPPKWTLSCGTTINGTFFMYGDVVISGSVGTVANPWITTILTYGSIQVTSPSLVVRPPVSSDGSLYKSQTKNLLFVAERDIDIVGNNLQNFRGITSAYEHVGISGDPVYYGYILAQNVSVGWADYIGTNYVEKNLISGNMRLTYNGDLANSTQGNAVPQATLY